MNPEQQATHEMQLGQSDERIHLQWRDDVISVTDALFLQAKNSILLYTDDLEAAVLNRQPVIDAITRLAVTNRYSYIHILIRNSKKAARSGNRLIELGRRLGPQMKFKKPSKHMRQSENTFLIVDDIGYLNRPRADRYHGIANFNAAGELAELKDYFSDLWKYAEDDVEMRQLYL